MNARQSPREHVRQACARYGSVDVVRRCAALLRGADPAGEEKFLRMLGFRGELDWLLKEPNPYWARVWAARALRYCWDDLAVAAVLDGLNDQAWRVVEHCAVVSGDRELADAAPTLVALAEHPVPRVRAAAARAMASVAEREHVPALLRLADDPEANVRTATERALAVLGDRLDLSPDDLAHYDR